MLFRMASLAAVFCFLTPSIAYSPAGQSVLTITQPTRAPGVLLAPGKYQIRYTQEAPNSFLVSIFSEDGRRLIASVNAVEQSGAASGSEFVFTSTDPPSLRAWSPPGLGAELELIWPVIANRPMMQEERAEPAPPPPPPPTALPPPPRAVAPPAPQVTMEAPEAVAPPEAPARGGSSAPPQQTPAPKPAAPPQAPVPLAPSGTLTFEPEADMPKYDSTLYVVAISANQSIDPRSAIANAGSQYTTLTTRIAGVVRASLDPGAEDGIIVTLLPDGGSPDRTLGADSPVAVWNWRVAFKPTLMQSQVMLYLSVGSVDASGKLVPFGEAYQVKVNLKSSASGMADMAEASLLPTIWDSFNKWVGGAVTLLLGALGTWIVGRIKRKPASRPASAAS